jgi:hypothetical protein
MKFQDLIKVKIIKNEGIIKERLEQIYQERRKWSGAKGPFDKSSIRKRRLILVEQQILENLITKNL